METIEELQRLLMNDIGQYFRGHDMRGHYLRMKQLVDDLLSAIEARGEAKGFEEGAEKVKEKIRKAGIPVSNVWFSPDGRVMKIESDGRDPMPSYFVPASTVAPKETT